MDKIYKSNDMENPDDIVVVKLDLKIKKKISYQSISIY